MSEVFDFKTKKKICECLNRVIMKKVENGIVKRIAFCHQCKKTEILK